MNLLQVIVSHQSSSFRNIFTRKAFGTRFLSTTKRVFENFEDNEPPATPLKEEAPPPIEVYASVLNPDASSIYEKAIRYLESSCGTIGFQTSVSYAPDDSATRIPVSSEVFSSALTYDLVRNLPDLSPRVPTNLLDFIGSHMTDGGTFNFFTKPLFNDDIDVTSVCLWALLQCKRVNLKFAKSIGRTISVNVELDKYYEPVDYSPKNQRKVICATIPACGQEEPEFVTDDATSLDAVVAANALRVLYFLGVENWAIDSQTFVYDWLEKKENFEKGTLFYHSPDSFLYFLSNILSLSPTFRDTFQMLLTERLMENLGKTKNPLSLAMRIITASNLGFLPAPSLPSSASSQSETESKSSSESTSDVSQAPSSDNIQLPKEKLEILKEERQLLYDQQVMDGSWPMDSLSRSELVYFGNRTLVTAFASKAIHVSNNLK